MDSMDKKMKQGVLDAIKLQNIYVAILREVLDDMPDNTTYAGFLKDDIELACNTAVENKTFNSGNNNTGHGNTGDWNTGRGNTGDMNAGNRNAGRGNTGDWNTGRGNTGDWNTGRGNTGHGNTGYWNTANFQSGFFNTSEQPVSCFNGAIAISRHEFVSHAGYQALVSAPLRLTKWVTNDDLPENEKTGKETGGKTVPIDWLEAHKEWWSQITPENRKLVQTLPGFCADIFKEITGIDVREDV